MFTFQNKGRLKYLVLGKSDEKKSESGSRLSRKRRMALCYQARAEDIFMRKESSGNREDGLDWATTPAREEKRHSCLIKNP